MTHSLQGVGRRLDGWPNRDLNVGAIVVLSPTLKPFEDVLGIPESEIRRVLASWGPGKFDAELVLDGKAFGPGGKSAATLLPPAFGLAGVSLQTWTGWGSVTSWNAFVANLGMHGKGTFYDPRLNDRTKFPIAARNGFGNVRGKPDLIGRDPSLRRCICIRSLCLRPNRAKAVLTGPQQPGEKPYSPARRDAAPVTCRRCSRSRAGICTQRQRSG